MAGNIVDHLQGVVKIVFMPFTFHIFPTPTRSTICGKIIFSSPPWYSRSRPMEGLDDSMILLNSSVIRSCGE